MGFQEWENGRVTCVFRIHIILYDRRLAEAYTRGQCTYSDMHIRND